MKLTSTFEVGFVFLKSTLTFGIIALEYFDCIENKPMHVNYL